MKSNSKIKIEELCLAGACNRGVCYLGCIKKLEEEQMLNIKKIVGVSIGAFIGACYIIGYTVSEMMKIIINKNTKEFQDITFTEKAVLKGENYRKWVSEVISAKVDSNITLKELYEKTKIDFIMSATCIYSNCEEFTEGLNYFSHELTPNIPLITAVTASMSFPFIFPPIVYKDCHFIDGGLLDNFPSHKISGDNSLGIKVNFTPINDLNTNSNPLSYIGKILELVSGRIKSLTPHNTKNIISISCDDFSIIDFEMSIDDKITLYKRGYNAVSEFNNIFYH